MAPVDSFLFEATKKAFCHGVVETIAGAAHITDKAVYFQNLSVFPIGIGIPDPNVQSILLVSGLQTN